MTQSSLDNMADFPSISARPRNPDLFTGYIYDVYMYRWFVYFFVLGPQPGIREVVMVLFYGVPTHTRISAQRGSD